MIFARLWLVLFIFLSASLVMLVNRHSFQTNIFSLLPNATDEQLPLQALDKYSEKLSRRVVFLVHAADMEESEQLTESFVTLLKNSHLFSDVEYRYSRERLTTLFQTYHAHRFFLLAEQDARHLEEGGAKWLANKLLQSLISPVSGSTSLTIKQDPFGLLAGYIGSLPRASQAATIRNGFITFTNNGKIYSLVSTILKGSAFDQDFQDKYLKLETRISQLEDDMEKSEIHGYGILYHAIKNRLIAQQEITYIGTASLVAILALFVFVFRRITALLYIALPLLVGATTALSVSLFIFGEIHLVTLVFGASLIGVSIDYTFHYCCANSDLAKSENGLDAIRLIRLSLTVGLLTSVVGYLTLSIPDFPSLRQMAVFSAAGLVGTYLTVLLWLPYLIKQPFNVNHHVSSIVARFIRKLSDIPQVPVWILPIMLILFVSTFIYTSEAKDNIRLMRTSLPTLNKTEDFFRETIQESPNSQYYVVVGNTPEQVLQRERELISNINSLNIKQSRTMSVSQWLLSKERQDKNYQLLYSSIVNNQALDKSLESMGLSAGILTDYRNAMIAAKNNPLTFDEFYNSNTSTFVKDLWLGRTGNNYYSVISLFGFPDTNLLHRIIDNKDDVFLIDRAGTVTRLMREYRVSVEKIAPVILAVIWLLLAIRYRPGGAVRIVSPPVLAALISLLLTQFIQGYYNLFNLFGLVVSIAVAIDYAVFIRESGGHQQSSYLAVSLAGLTTIISLGALALSRTPALQGFGLTLLLGIIFSFILTNLAVRPEGKKA